MAPPRTAVLEAPVGTDDMPGWDATFPDDGLFGWGSSPALSGAPLSARGRAAPAAPALVLPPPYTDLGPLGQGGMGEVRAVWDGRFGRRLALKLMRPALAGSRAARQRFLREGTMTAGLAHPGIVAVHDRGELDDGRLWFTMKEVRGQTLDPRGGLPRRRWVELLLRVCEAVAYAHQQGIVHRDLKPGNVMVGEFGEVMVMDWGLARRLDDGPAAQAAVDETLAATLRAPGPDGAAPLGGLTGAGAVLGTPGWMAPEQAAGALVGPPADVWALGRMLALAAPAGADDALDEIVDAATAPEAAARPADAGQLAARLQAWLDGSLRRERAQRVLDSARAALPQIHRLRSRADQADQAAAALLRRVGPRAPVAERASAWRDQETAAQLRREAEVAEVAFVHQVRSALQVDPDLGAAHDLLAAHHRAQLVQAEAQGDDRAAARHAASLRAHDRLGQHQTFLRGDGTVSLATAPLPGATVHAHRMVTEARRLRPSPVRRLGPTPLDRVALPRGSWLLTVTPPGGGAPVPVPVLLPRLGHWDAGTVPLHRGPPGACLVAGGPFQAGGDPEAGDALPATTVVLPAFWIETFPVTVARYAAWLDWLWAEAGPAAAAAMAPRAPDGSPAGLAPGPDGARCIADPTGRPWAPDEPVTLVRWDQARAFARWQAAQTGWPWRLPRELEWEKAARGVDGRCWPWGDHIDPAWAHYADSLGTGDTRAPVTAWPEDRSVYGVRGLAGGVRDLCADPWREGGWIDEDGAMMSIPDETGAPLRMVRGGNALSAAPLTRAACRFVVAEDQPLTGVGFRLVCDDVAGGPVPVSSPRER